MSADSPQITDVTFTAADGAVLEAQLACPPKPKWAVAVAHPHPRFGGDMHNNVVAAIWRAAPVADVAVLRFNFRGVGRSTGLHGDGTAERLDLAAALAALHAHVPDVALIAAGYSFGAEVALTTDHADVVGWFAVAPVFRLFPLDDYIAGRDARPKRLVIAEHDQYAPPAGARESTRGWTNTTIDIASMSDHFFAAGTRQVVESFAAFTAAL